MGIKVWDGSKWAIASQIKTWDGSAWKETSNANVHIWTGTAWQKIHPPVQLEQNLGYSVSATDPTNAGSGGNAQARINIFANGKIQTFESTSVSGTVRTSSADWLLTGANSEYDVYVTNFSGSSLQVGSGPTNGTRTQLSSDVQYSLYLDSNGTGSSSFDITICANNQVSTNTAIQKASISLYVDVGSL
jgi:hypothetical protein